MKEIIKRTALAFVLSLGIFVRTLSINTINSSAAELTTYDYTVAYDIAEPNASKYTYTSYTYHLQTEAPLYAFIWGERIYTDGTPDKIEYGLVMVDDMYADDEVYELYSANTSGGVVRFNASTKETEHIPITQSNAIQFNRFNLNTFKEFVTNAANYGSEYAGSWSFGASGISTIAGEYRHYFTEEELAQICWTVPLFSNSEELINYLETGDDSGQINKPGPDFTAPHDFSKDLIYQDIPLPELSRLGYNGFVVENIGEYYMDVIMETRLYGVKHVPVEYDNKYIGNTPVTDAFEWGTTADTAWTYKRHYYNLDAHVPISSANLSSNSAVYIDEIYGVDNYSVFEADFKAWSSEYPESKNLPDYSWTKTGAKLNYSLHYVYDANDNAPPRVTNNGMAETIYYVRFFDKDMRTGQWVKYSYRCGPYDVETETIPGNVVTEIIDGGIITDTGTGVITKDTTIGVTDINGYISYPTPNTYSTEYTLTGFVQTLELFANALTRVPAFVNNMFGFLPWWSQGLLGLAVGAAVVMRFLGR